MHWTTHLIAGCSLGYLIGRPGPAALAGLCSHVLLDMLPHHDPDSELGYAADSAVGLACLAGIAASRRFHKELGDAALWGAIGSGLPDVELTIKLFRHIEDERYLFPSHNGRHPHRETPLLESTVLQTATAAVFFSWSRLREGP